MAAHSGAPHRRCRRRTTPRSIASTGWDQEGLSWTWELPGGYVDSDENPAITVAREVEEETGWRPRRMTLLTRFQPLVGGADLTI
ncbi:MAG: NUDIX domain-containing protein [Nocardioidaceae bacterium]